MNGTEIIQKVHNTEQLSSKWGDDSVHKNID